ncbi:MAG: SCO family protein [Cyclobacteriaceae bacterium]
MKKITIIALAALIGACSPNQKGPVEIELPFYTSADLTPRWIDEPTDTVHTIDPFSFVNQNGDTITEEAYQNKVYVANFFFTICPGVCPKMNGNLHLVQDEFQESGEVQILSHSVMPWVDSVAQLHTYALRNDVNPDMWNLVTGDKADIYRLARESYFADEGFGKQVTSAEDFLHTEKLILIDQNRRIRGIYNGTLPLDVKRMIEDIRQLL